MSERTTPRARRPPGAARFRSAAIAPVVGLAALWAAMIALVGPAGDFPLDDDWSYGRAVFGLVSDGHLHFTGWTMMPLVVQVLWGALFCKLFGTSFTVLRASTLVLALSGVIATYAAAREAGARRSVAYIVAAAVAVNPLYFALSCSFMTDVPFFALAAIALWGFLRALRRGSNGALAVATVASVLATLIRQFGLVLPVAYAVAALVGGGDGERPVNRETAAGGGGGRWRGLDAKRLAGALLPAVLAGSALFAFERWLAATSGLPKLYRHAGVQIARFFSQGGVQILVSPLFVLGVLGVYLGLFLLPVSIATFASPAAGRRRWLAAWLGTAAIVTAVLWKRDTLMPLTGNTLWESGVGPPTLRDVFLELLPRFPVLPAWFWAALTFAGIAGAGPVLAGVVSAVARLMKLRGGRGDEASWHGAPIAALGLSVLVLYALLFHLGQFFDRYVLSPMPLVALLLLTREPARPARWRLAAAGAGLALFAAFSVAATHDYLAWNRARWQALRQLTDVQHVPPASIDGGLEFNGFYLYSEDYSVKPGKSWWWVDDDRYLIVFGPIEGYRVVVRVPYSRWLVPGAGAVYALERTGSG